MIKKVNCTLLIDVQSTITFVQCPDLFPKLQQVFCSSTVFLQRGGLYVLAAARGSECSLKLTGY